jgi:hypothetical protein
MRLSLALSALLASSVALMAAAQSVKPKAAAPPAASAPASTPTTDLAGKPAEKPAAKQVEFLRDVAPLLDRAGCSISECHGKFGGRGGLQISLLTLSPEEDYEPIVYGNRGRRINFADPAKSLFLLKAAFAVPHAGGMRFKVGSPEYNTILKWIQQGAPFSDKDPRLVTLVLKPGKTVLPKVGAKVQLRAIATYSDGTTRDVTAHSVFESTNDAVLGVTRDGLVSGKRWGGGAVMARYLGSVSAAFMTLPQARKGPYPTVAANNVIDRLVFSNLKGLNVLPSPLSTDDEFLRRVTLDTLGRLPTIEERDAFVKDTRTDKRVKLVDSLLDRPEFADYRTYLLADLLRVNPRKLGNGNGTLSERSAVLFHEWIWKSVRDNKPWDQFARELVTARGSTYQVGPANFYRVERSANDRMENIGQAFLGVRMSCARCHKHPFDRWTTDDYWNFAAWTGKVTQRGGRLEDELVIEYAHGGQVRNQSVNGKNRGKVAPPTFLGDGKPVTEAKDYVLEFADWMTKPENPFFARATVNRLWSYYFGKGIIHPVDDMRATSPESVPGLLDALAKELVNRKWDVKHVIRLILNSRTYQATSVPNESNRQDDRFFSRFQPKPMPAPVLLDMINAATGADERFGSFPERARAVQAEVPNRSTFLTAFGQSHREFLADINPELEPNLVQTLLMINSPYIENKIKNGKTAADVAKAAQSDEELVDQLYLRTLNRPPTTVERSRAVGLLKTAKDRKESAQDLLWALVSSREFYFNH